MSFLLRTLLTTVLLGGSLIGLPALAADTSPPSAEKVQQSLDSLADRKLADAEAKPIKASLENTLKLLAAKADSEKQLLELKGRLADAPKLINENQKALGRLKASSEKPASQRYNGSSATQLEMLLNEQSTQLAAWQKEMVDAKSEILTAQTRPERAQADLSKNQTRLLEIAGLIKAGKEGAKPISDERRNELLAEQAMLTSQNLLLRQQLAGNNLLLDLASSQRDLLAERIGREERETLELQAMISDKRREQSEKTVAELSKDSQAAGTDSLLSQQSAANLKLSDYLLRTTDRLNTLTRRNLEAKQQLDNLTQGEQALDEQINVLRGSLLLAKILYQQKQSLPVIKTDQDLADEIADLRLYQFELNQKRDEINNTQVYLDNLLAQQPQESVTPQLRHDLGELVDTRLELMERLNHELNALLNEAITLQLNQKQLKETSDSLRATLDEQMFWIPSNRPLDLSWFKMTPSLLHHQLAEVPWGSGVKELFEGLIDRPFLFLPLLLLVAGLLWKRRFLYDKLESLNDDIGHFKRDSQAHTPLALLLAVLLALPGTLALGIAGLALLLDARGQNATLGSALLEMAQVWLVFYTAHRILRPGGIAERHFHWSQAQVQFLGKLMRRLGLVVMSLVAVVTVAEHSPASLADDVIGIAVVLFGYGAMTWLLAQLLFNSPSSERPSMIKMIVGLGFTALPVALFLAVGFGYYYTALKLTDRLIDTLFLLMFWMVVEATFVRGMGVAARRLAYQRALSKRQNAPKEGIEGSEVVVEEPTLGIEQINEQSMRLIRLGLLIGFVVTLYWVWADLISVVSYLDNVTLYQYTSGTGDAASTTPISLSDFIMALVIAAVTVALARNLPGLLEVLVLQRLTLAQGSAYAITTLLSYTISGVGIVSALSTLGVSWDKLQWLVAALSVGLGFGLQAIFSNFVSGLIILFERPVRIGDVVTIGTLSGTVSRIRIRATTITDFDRKEIIVPNQTFITGQLVNWSLSDTVTRVTIKIGLAYESDLPLARKIMLEAAHANPRILRDPEPVLYFTTISASTFDYELRFHVRELGDRNPAVDETLTRIALAFREAGIDMAFNQVDVFLKNFQGQEAQVIVGQQQPAATPVKLPAKPDGDKA